MMISQLAILISVAVTVCAFDHPSDVGPCNKKSAGLFPHPDECQLYYNCSINDSPFFLPGGKGVSECKYPLLFDESSRKCMEEVQCRSRKVKKNGCDYYYNQCNGPNCILCNVLFPKCEGLTDGIYPHASKLGLPHLMVCKNERFVEELYCPAWKR